jgi:hypothetical protein
METVSFQCGCSLPSDIQRLVSEHVVGANHAGKLGAVLTWQVWHRQLVDCYLFAAAWRRCVSSVRKWL